MTKTTRRSLLSRLVLVLWLALLPAAALSVYQIALQYQEARRQAQVQAQSLAGSIARMFDGLIDNGEQVLLTLSQVPSFRDHDTDGCTRILAGLAADGRMYAGFSAALPSGEVFASVPGSSSTVSYRDRAWFQQVLDTRKFAVSGYLSGRLSGAPIIVLAQPVSDANGVLSTVITASIALDWMRGLAVEIGLPETCILNVYDRGGTLLVQIPDDPELVGKALLDTPLVTEVLRAGSPKAIALSDLTGEPRLFGFGSAAAGDLIVAVGVRQWSAFSQARASLLRGLLTLGLTLVLTPLVMGMAGRTLVLKPVHRVVRAAKCVAAGDLGHMESDPYATRELGELGDAVDHMRATLAVRENEAEEALAKERDSRRRYEILFETMVEGFAVHEIICDASGTPTDYRFLEVNRAFEVLTGLKRDRVRGRTAREVLPDLEPSWIRRYGEVARTMVPQEFDSYAEPLGRHFRVVCFSPQKGIFGTIFTDITKERRQADQISEQLHWMTVLNSVARAIAEPNTTASIARVVLNHLEETMDFALGGIATYDSGGPSARVLVLSARGTELCAESGLAMGGPAPVFRREAARAPGDGVVEVLDLAEPTTSSIPETAERLRHAILATGLRYEAQIRIGSPGKPFGAIFMLYAGPVEFSEHERGFLEAVAQQVALAAHNAALYEEMERAYTDLRTSARGLMEKERLSAMGQMASGIAHDINNLLVPITLYSAALLQGESGLSQKGRGYLETMQKAAEEIEATATRMRAFYRRRDDEGLMQAVDINTVANEAIEITKPRWSDMVQRLGLEVSVRTALAAELPPVLGVGSEIRDALVNLIVNSVDALPKGGTVTVSTHADNGLVSVEVADTGIGMTQVQRDRCLEPFYTTKGERGTGLGLSIVFGTLQRHGGEVQVESELGKGTVVRLLFPAASDEIAAQPSGERTESLPPIRILCIDDDPLVLGALLALLEIEGHEVEGAEDGPAGLAAFAARKERSDPFDLVITDMGMPHMDGREVALRIKESSPNTPVVMLSGWGSQMRVNGDSPAGVECVIGKPPTAEGLRRCFKRILRRES